MAETQRQRIRSTRCRFAAAMLALSLLVPAGAGAAAFEDVRSDVLGTYDGVEYVLYTGRFTGTTAQGAYRMPFEIAAPRNPADGNGRVLLEPPHFALRAFARDSLLGPELLYEKGFAHATVGFGEWGFNRLDFPPTAADLVIAGSPAGSVPPDDLLTPSRTDVEIIARFARALRTAPFPRSALGEGLSVYGYGLSQSSEVLLGVLYRPDAAGLFDFTLLQATVWNPAFAVPETTPRLPVPFEPFDGSERTLFVQAEGDFFLGESLAIRGATADPRFRVYEVAGAPHLPLSGPVPGTPLTFNALDHNLVARAAFVAGDQWAARGTPPPDNAILDPAPAGAPDPVYGFPTGIARDVNGNAAGGVRLPSVATGAVFHVASLPAFLGGPPAPNLFLALSGLQFDLTCIPSRRFANHGRYVRAVGEAIRALRKGRYLLPEDAENLLEEAAESAVGKPGSCEVVP